MIMIEELDWPIDTSTNCQNHRNIERCLGRDLEALSECHVLSVTNLGENLGPRVSRRAEDETKKSHLLRPSGGRSSSGRRTVLPG